MVGGIIVFDKGEEAYLYKMFIIPALQNKGIGTQTISFTERELSRVKKWALHTPYLSYRNHHFYEKLGYSKVGETNPKVPEGFRLFTYEKYVF